MQIVLAIHEWASGILESSDGNLALLKEVAKWERQSKNLLADHRKLNLKEWLRFSTRVHNFARSNTNTMTPTVVTIFSVDFDRKGIKIVNEDDV